VPPGDTITATVEVIERRLDKPIWKLDTTITNQHSDVVLDGSAVVYQADLEGLDGAESASRESER
jgi:acyl dehydratase